MHLVDTSVWIDYLKGRSNPRFDKIVEIGEICINEIIFNEICFGARDTAQLRKYKEYFGRIPFAVLTSWHEEVADLRFLLKKKGVITSLSDALIAQAAIKNGLTLLSRDRDFQRYTKYCALKLEWL